MDFRKLNKIMIAETYPFPLIDDLILKTKSSKWFLVFDINSAFWSIPIHYQDQQKTGFVTQLGHYQWRNMPFGLKNCSAIFQRILAGIICKYKLNLFCINYLDDLLIFSKFYNDHLVHIEQLFQAILQEGFRLKFIKCSFARDTVEYLGHVMQNDTVQPLNDNLVSIRNFPQPRTIKHIRQFLGKVNFHSKYIHNSEKILEPFHHLLQKNVKFEWSQSCENAFHTIKDCLTSTPILAIFDCYAVTNIYTWMVWAQFLNKCKMMGLRNLSLIFQGNSTRHSVKRKLSILNALP